MNHRPAHRLAGRCSAAALLSTLLAGLLALGPSTARAAPVDEARERFGRGVQLFHEGSLEAALAEFQKAYQLAPLVPAALQHRPGAVRAARLRRGRCARSGNTWPRGATTSRPSAGNQVEAEIRKLEKRVGYLTITTNVSGAQISVDGVPMGISPFTAPVLVNPGRPPGVRQQGRLPARDQHGHRGRRREAEGCPST